MLLPPAGFGATGVARVVDDVVDRARPVEGDGHEVVQPHAGVSGTSKDCVRCSVGSTLV